MAAENADFLARHSAKEFGFVYAAGTTICVVAWTLIATPMVWRWYVVAGVCFLFLATVLLIKKMPAYASITLTLTCTFLIMIAGAVDTYQMAKYRIPSPTLFGGFKFIALLAALIAPAPVWVGYFIISLCTLGSIVQFNLASQEIREGYTVFEPWTTLIYMVIAFFVLRHRIHTRELERELVHVQMEKRSLDQLARTFLAMRDMTNSPLQSIELVRSLLAKHSIEPENAAKHLESSLIRLRQLSAILTVYENDVDWTTTDISFDAVKKLEGLLQKKNA